MDDFKKRIGIKEKNKNLNKKIFSPELLADFFNATHECAVSECSNCQYYDKHKNKCEYNFEKAEIPMNYIKSKKE